MYPKVILLSLTALACFTSNAQDHIYTRKKGVIEVKIMEVTPKIIIYRKADNLAGKDYDIEWADVHKIEYANGKEEFREKYKPIPREKKPSPKINYGSNIVSAAITNVNDEGVGFGVAYEYSMDKDKYLALHIPLNFAFAAPNTNNNVSNKAFVRSRSIIQVMPSLRFYPTGNNGKVRYAVGPQLTYETGRKFAEMETYDQQGISVYKLDEHEVQKMGIMVNNSLNMFTNAHIYMALDLGLGFTYMNKLGGAEQGTKQLVQFNFRMGYRF